MFSFEWYFMLALLPLPVLAWWLLPQIQQSSGAIKVPYFSKLPAVAESAARSWRSPLSLLLILVWILLILAAARPQWVGEAIGVNSSGRNLMLAVDVSGSMKTRDMQISGAEVDRLQVVKLLGSEFLERRHGDRIGLVLFGTNAYLQAPLSFDRATVATLLNESLIGIAGERTAIGDAIGLVLKRLHEADAEHKVMVLMTDGANTAGNVDPTQAAELAARAGMKIHTVGIGAELMQVDSLFGRRNINPSAELDEEMLTQIASVTGGQYFRARNPDELAEIYQVLDRIEPVPQPDLSQRRVSEYFFWPLSLAMLLALGMGIIRVLTLHQVRSVGSAS